MNPRLQMIDWCLLYSAPTKGTLSVINVLNKTRGNGRDAYDSKSKFIRRYHVCTGDEDKADSIQDFEDERFPIFSSTMALGLNNLDWPDYS